LNFGHPEEEAVVITTTPWRMSSETTAVYFACKD
jgi:hypothetical protein